MPAQRVDAFYEKRIQRLKQLDLETIIAIPLQLSRLTRTGQAGVIVMELIEEFLLHTDDGGDTLKTNAKFWLQVVEAKKKPSPLYFQYQDEFAKARNRITLHFIKTFCLPDHTINWEKLIEFSASRSQNLA